jgi:hypothetical protein
MKGFDLVRGFVADRSFARGALSLCAIALLAGCSRAYRVDPVLSDVEPFYDGTRPWMITSPVPGRGDVRVIDPYRYAPAGEREPLFRIASGFASGFTGDQQKLARNRLQEAIVSASDQSVSAHLSGLRATETGFSTLLGASALALSGAASVSSAGGAQALAAAATGLGGTRAMVNEEVYRNALSESIVSLIETDRARKLAQMRTHQQEPIETYTVERAIADAQAYHQAGSAYAGFALARSVIERSIGLERQP